MRIILHGAGQNPKENPIAEFSSDNIPQIGSKIAMSSGGSETLSYLIHGVVSVVDSGIGSAECIQNIYCEVETISGPGDSA